MNILTHTLPVTLQQARKARRLSQVQLSKRLLVSQRHVSFVESGRAKPSRNLLIAWLQALDAPLVVRNAAMLQAGYAPAYSAASQADPALVQAHSALIQLIEAHDPQPAFVIGAQWDVLHLNRGGEWIAKLLIPWAADLPAGMPLNLLDALCHPDGYTKNMVNLDEVGPVLLAHLRDHASVMPSIMPKVEAFASLLHSRCGSQSLSSIWPHSAAPVLTKRFATPYGEIAFFSMFTTFGTPKDITLASLRVEHMFAANDATKDVLIKQIKL
jgi:transcriptional regulator with XRE-family HTH domain